MNSLQGQLAVVTGASSGIGRAIALALAASGARLCLVGRKRETLQAVARAAGGEGAQHRCYEADLAVHTAVQRLLEMMARDLSAVDILVHGAGVIGRGTVEAGANDLDDQYMVNLRAPYMLTRALMPALKAQRGQVLFVNSSAGLTATAGSSQYAASKHALKAFADSLRDEVNPDGVRVISLFLGRTATPMQAAVHADEGKPYRPELLMQPEDVAEMAVHALALARTAEVTEIRMRPMLKT